MRIVWLPAAVADLQRLREFILPHNREAAQRAVKVIKAAVAMIETSPRIGKSAEDLPDYQDLPIPFGAAGYLLRYRIYQGAIYIVAIRHGKEVGYSGGRD
ncbi:type II toxin-antitoxin system RelE/ParE family toxin [Desulfuromonas acetexigens]|uniref:Type II toxin-antitoxin system RelE/ParE family toxin n=1 Tax=Trichloromonas acetexigens TaxID=38815 RepID=A0A550J997_9BACT|nr:type II toxin-antitoxin system RelE/ParE family toxin [Desulfuromonas acetexigens]TRO79800.1 type II toxin-antitoxin system RelE/ParE family toxin [Desulfuromonas acetexigens]